MAGIRLSAQTRKAFVLKTVAAEDQQDQQDHPTDVNNGSNSESTLSCMEEAGKAAHSSHTDFLSALHSLSSMNRRQPALCQACDPTGSVSFHYSSNYEKPRILTYENESGSVPFSD